MAPRAGGFLYPFRGSRGSAKRAGARKRARRTARRKVVSTAGPARVMQRKLVTAAHPVSQPRGAMSKAMEHRHCSEKGRLDSCGVRTISAPERSVSSQWNAVAVLPAV
ncbi:hypothetical protein JCM18897A_60050 [Streptomyces sp. JCM 18897]